jgi:hypothetical protein
MARLVLAVGIPLTLLGLVWMLLLLKPPIFFGHGAISNFALTVALAAAVYLPFLVSKLVVRYEKCESPRQ